MQDRELHLAEIKKNAEDYKAKKGESSASGNAAAPAKEGGFNF